jgi:hypothetical protein
MVLMLSLLPALLLGAEKKFEKEFTVSEDGLLIVKSDYGDITVRGSGSDNVVILVTMNGSQGDLEDYQVTASQSGNTVELRGKGAGDDWFSWDIDDLEVKFIVEVPEKFNLNVATAGGDMRVNNVNGNVQLRTPGGDVVLEELAGEIYAESSGGDIRAMEMRGNFRGTTSGGDVVVEEVSGNIHAETSGGDVRIGKAGGKVNAQTSGGNISIVLAGENKGVMAETSGGDIDVMAAREIQANLDASTSGGSVMCGLPITLTGEIDESRIQGTLNGGGELIHVQTSGGDIRIRQTEQ